MNELVYIAKLKAGGPKAPVESTLVPPKDEPAPQKPGSDRYAPDSADGVAEIGR